VSRERSILFTGPMVRAILREVDPKTQTRRMLKIQSTTSEVPYRRPDGLYVHTVCGGHGVGDPFPCPYGQRGDVLLVKESTWMFCEAVPNGTTPTGKPKFHYKPLPSAPWFYVASMEEGWKPKVTPDHPETGNRWVWRVKIGRFLPRWAVRIRLEIVDVRIERVADISEEDAKAEGCERADFSKIGEKEKSIIDWPMMDAARPFANSYALLWESINGLGSWATNPFVWVVEFKRT
jgi:hypothetical protein